MMFEGKMFAVLWTSTAETFYMVSVASLITTVFGIPLGVLLTVTRPGHVLENKWFYRVLGFVVNFVRSIPFIIFMILIDPFTRALVGSGVGATAVIVPLALASIAFMGRLSETALFEVPAGVIEAAQASGATNWQLMRHVMLPEAMPGLIMAVTILIVTLIGYSAMAGVLGGGGLGDLAVRYGYQRYQTDVMWACVAILAFSVQGLQFFGETLVRRFNHR